MNSFFQRFAAAAAVGTLLATSVSVQAAVEQPDAFVKRISDTLVSRLAAERNNYRKNPAVLYSIVQQNIEPYVDFIGFARGVMGQYYQQSTPAQRQSFEKTFRESLLRTYANGLGAYNNQSYSIRKFVPSRDPSKAVVSMDFKTDSSSTIPVTYQLVQSGNSWKVRNVQLNGIDLGLTFRNQFTSTVQSSGGNLDRAIQNFAPKASASN